MEISAAIRQEVTGISEVIKTSEEGSKISVVIKKLEVGTKISEVISHSIKAAIKTSQRDMEVNKVSAAAMDNRRAGKHLLGLMGLNHTKELTATALAYPLGTVERAAMAVILTNWPNTQTYF